MSNQPSPPAPHVVVANTGQEGLPLAHSTIGARPDYELVEAAGRELQEAVRWK